VGLKQRLGVLIFGKHVILKLLQQAALKDYKQEKILNLSQKAIIERI